MKIEYFLIFAAEPKRSVAVEQGAVLKKEVYGDAEFTIVSMKDRLAAHNKAARNSALVRTGPASLKHSVPKFTDEDRFLLWLHQSGEHIVYVKAEKASDPSSVTASTA